MQSKIAELSAAVSELARAYILEPQAVLREKVIACHLLVSEIAYKGDPALDEARKASQEPFRPVLSNPETIEPSVRYNPDTNEDEAQLQIVVRWMTNYWGGPHWLSPDSKWVKDISLAKKFPSITEANKFIEDVNSALKITTPFASSVPGLEVVTYHPNHKPQSDGPGETLEGEAPTIGDVSDSFTQSELPQNHQDFRGAQAFFEEH